jgi:hypothetical protein
MAHAALERLVDFLGSRNTTRLIIRFQNVFVGRQGVEKVFTDTLPTKYIDMDVSYVASSNAADILLRGVHYRNASPMPPIRSGDTWGVYAFSAGRYIEFSIGDAIIRFVT